MKVASKTWYGKGRPPQREIAKAFEVEFAPSLTGEFSYEHPMAAALGRIVQLLHEKGALSKEDVLSLLGDGWRECKPEDEGGQS